ncbi:ATP-dependent DNA helicase PIF1-like [Helianthus annuus]|uniref:ATP-dependent DNA helicase PIF1-like n=1 Tax=Helianthus annuus TaxID=4232 RepID=UPI000B8EF1DC|nr:ATP-dependent DNA helicase PIF1-like [Helianthus annuus]
MGKNFNEFDLPKITDDVNLQDAGYRELQEEYGIVLEPEHLSAKDSLNPDQKNVFDEIMMHVDNDLPGVFFIDGPGGTGKTFLYIALLTEIRSRGLIALAIASSGAAANNMPRGRTAHSRFKIPLNLENNSMCNIKKQSGAAKLIRSAKIIIWDEASMAKRQAIEAVDRTFQDIIGVSLPFGGKIMVMGGDFRQVLPVIKRGTRAQIVDSSVRMSPLWSLTKKMRLTINMRALKDPWFSKFLLRAGDGTEEPIEGNYIRIPDDMTIQCNNRENAIKELIHAIFPSIEDNVYSSDYIISRAILSTKNDSVDEINNQMIEIFQGEEKVYYSFDEAEDDQRNFCPVEFLNSLNVSGLPPHKLRLKIGCPIILLRNIDPSHGLCNGTRLICKGFMRNVIDAEIAVGQHAGKRVFLPRIPLTLSEDDMFPFKLKRKQFPINIDPSHGLCNGTRLICKGFMRNVIDAEIAVGQHAGKRVFLPRIPLTLSEDDMFPFKLKRKQFPIRLSFSMTINKAQGQTIPNVGIYLPDSVFSHGQLYVALSRGISRQSTKVLVHLAKEFKQSGVYTSNVVYQEVLRD